MIRRTLDALLKTRRSSVALLFSLNIVPLVLTIGGGIDYSRAVHFRSDLQGVADSAALAAAALWTGTSNTAATTAAANYIAAGTSRLAPNTGVTNSVVTSSPTNGYQVDVTLTSGVQTSFVGIIIPSISVIVYSTALNPKPYGHFCAGGAASTATMCGATSAFSASAADTNSIYWYYVPSDNSVPTSAQLTLLWSNASGSNVNPAPIPLDNGQRVGFAMKNVTGNYGQTCTGSGRSRVCTQNTNGYGAAMNSVHWSYSHLVPPTNSTAGYNSTNNPSNINGVNGATGNNCSLVVTQNNTTTGAAVAPSSGACKAYNDANALTYAAPTCSQLAGKVVTFWFNDMGGTGDDRDFNDGVFTFYCGGNGTGAGGSTGSTTARSVVLIK